MKYLLGLDIGTSGVKGLIINSEGAIIKSKLIGYDVNIIKNGWIEQSPECWWSATKIVISELMKETKISKDKLVAISFSGQMHSSVFLDENLQVIRPAILWSDTRTTGQCEKIYNSVGGLDVLLDYVSNPALEGFTAPKVLWLKDNEENNYSKVKYVVLPKDYIRYKLTGEIYTEVSDAAGTLLFDVKKKCWNKELMEKLNINNLIVPNVLESTDVAGRVEKLIARELGLSEDTLVIAGGADNACAAIGSGIVDSSKAVLSIGTSGTIVAFCENPNIKTKGNVHLFNHSYPNSWYLMTVMLSAGMSLKWIKEQILNIDMSYNQLTALASKSSIGSNGVIFLPYLFGERSPHSDPKAKSIFYGLSGATKTEDMIRSVLEGVGFGFKDCLNVIEENVNIDEIRITGGGANSPLWVSIIADIINKPINTINIQEGPAFGAAIIAGVGAGVFNDFHSILNKVITIEKTIRPDTENVKLYEEYYSIYMDLYKNLRECNEIMHRFNLKTK